MAANPLYDDVPMKVLNEKEPGSKSRLQQSISNPGYGRTLLLTVNHNTPGAADNFGYQTSSTNPKEDGNPLYEPAGPNSTGVTHGEDERNPSLKQSGTVDINPLYEVGGQFYDECKSSDACINPIYEANDSPAAGQSYNKPPIVLATEGLHVNANPIYEGADNFPNNLREGNSSKIKAGTSCAGNEIDINPLYETTADMNP